MCDFQKLSQTSSVPVRWLNVRDVNEQGCLSLTSCFIRTSDVQRDYFKKLKYRILFLLNQSDYFLLYIYFKEISK
jgi:hypothetical protein